MVLKGKENKIDKKIEEDKIIKDFEQKCYIKGDNSYEIDSYNSDDNNDSYDYGQISELTMMMFNGMGISNPLIMRQLDGIFDNDSD